MKVRAHPIHFEVTAVRANDGRKNVSRSSAYIRRSNVREDRSSLTDAGAYIRRERKRDWTNTEVAEVGFFCRGSHTRESVWGAVDQAFRTKTGEYSRRGGRSPGNGKKRTTSGTPRLALFIDATLPLDISEDRKVAIGVEMAEAFVERYGCAVEAAWHIKGGVIDHLHLLVSTRRVDEDGVGPVIRQLNGIAGKYGGAAVREGELRLSPDMEWMRSSFAGMLERVTGHPYDSRSYKRQKSGIAPVPYVSRKRIEAEKRDGRDTWRDERRALIAARETFARKIENSIISASDQIGLIGTEEAVLHSVDAIEVAQPANVAETPTSVSGVQRDAGIIGVLAEAPLPVIEVRPAPAISSAVVTSLAGLALPVEQGGRNAEQTGASANRRVERIDPSDLVAEQWRQVDEQNRRDASAEMSQRNAEREASAQKVSSPQDLGIFPPPSDPHNRFGEGMRSADRQKANKMARGADRFASAYTQRPDRVSVDMSSLGKLKSGSAEDDSVARREENAFGDRARVFQGSKDQEHSFVVRPPAPNNKPETTTSPTAAKRDEKVDAKKLTGAIDHVVSHVKSRSPTLAAVPRLPDDTQTVSWGNAGRRIDRSSAAAGRPNVKPGPSQRGIAQAKDERGPSEHRVQDLGGAQQARPTESPSAPTSPPNSQIRHPDTQHHRMDRDASAKRKSRLSPSFLVRLATLLQFYGRLAVHADWLAELAGLDREALDHEVRMQSAANAMMKVSPHHLRKEFLAAIEKSEHRETLAPAVDALLKQSPRLPKFISPIGQSVPRRDGFNIEK